jgi:hypothetical protein
MLASKRKWSHIHISDESWLNKPAVMKGIVYPLALIGFVLLTMGITIWMIRKRCMPRCEAPWYALLWICVLLLGWTLWEAHHIGPVAVTAWFMMLYGGLYYISHWIYGKETEKERLRRLLK